MDDTYYVSRDGGQTTQGPLKANVLESLFLQNRIPDHALMSRDPAHGWVTVGSFFADRKSAYDQERKDQLFADLAQGHTIRASKTACPHCMSPLFLVSPKAGNPPSAGVFGAVALVVKYLFKSAQGSFVCKSCGAVDWNELPASVTRRHRVLANLKLLLITPVLAGAAFLVFGGRTSPFRSHEADSTILLNDLAIQQTFGLMGKPLPDLDASKARQGEAQPVVAFVRERAERAKAASADFQRTLECFSDPFNAFALSDPETRKQNAIRLARLEEEGALLEREARRLVGPEFEADLQALPAPEAMKKGLSQATASNPRFAACMGWIRVNRQIVDHLKAASKLTKEHLLLLPGRPPLWDTAVPATAFKRQMADIQALVRESEALRRQTAVRLVQLKN